LIIEAMSIPMFNGGIYYNGKDITLGSATSAAVQSKAKAENDFNVDMNNQTYNPSDGLGRQAHGFAAPSFTLTAASLSSGSTDPEIIIDVGNIALYADQKTGAIPPAQTITLKGNVNAPTAKLTVKNPSNGGSIVVTGEVMVKTLVLESKSSVSITGVQQAHIGGDPIGNFVPLYYQGVYNPEASNRLNRQITRNDYSTNNGITNIKAERVTVDAEYLNLNGTIQAGSKVFNLTLDQSIANQILAAQRGGMNFTTIEVPNAPDFSLIYDRQSAQLIVKALRPGGGVVDLAGRIVNTGYGRVIANAGYPEITVTNNINMAQFSAQWDLVIEDLDTDRRGVGQIFIRDKQTGWTTLYTMGDDSRVKVERDRVMGGSYSSQFYGSVGGGEGVIESVLPDYTPQAGLRYAWAIGQETRTRETARWEESNWLGIFNLGSRGIPVPPVTQTLSSALVPNSNYFYSAPGQVNDAYNYAYDEVITSATEWKQTYYNVRSSWYGKKTYTYQYNRNVGKFLTHSHSVKADYAIDIDFLWNNQGKVDIDAKGADLIIDGRITNTLGAVTLASQRDVTAKSSVDPESPTGGGQPKANILGRQITITAGGRIGTDSTALPITISTPANGASASGYRLDATAVTGINIRQYSGTLRVGTVTAASGDNRGAVILSGDGSYNPANSNDIGGIVRAVGGSHLVRGGSITLNSTKGGLGLAGTGNDILIDTGVRSDDVLSVLATSDVYLREINDGNSSRTDDLRVKEISAAGQAVWINVENGSLIDGNGKEVVDERAVSELMGTVWTDMQLTADTGGNQKVEDAKTQLRATKTREYSTFWTWRATQEAAYSTYWSTRSTQETANNLTAVLAGNAEIVFSNEREAELLAEYRSNIMTNLEPQWGLVTGTATANAVITVTWDRTVRTVTAAANGTWSASFTKTELDGVSDALAPTVTGTYANLLVQRGATEAAIEAAAQALLAAYRTRATADFLVLDGVFGLATYGAVTGTAAAGAAVNVTWGTKTVATKADIFGNWSAAFAYADVNTLADSVTPTASTGTVANYTRGMNNADFDSSAYLDIVLADDGIHDLLLAAGDTVSLLRVYTEEALKTSTATATLARATTSQMNSAASSAAVSLATMINSRTEQFRTLSTYYAETTFATLAGTGTVGATVTVVWNGISKTCKVYGDGRWAIAFSDMNIGDQATESSVSASTGSTTITKRVIGGLNTDYIVPLTVNEETTVAGSIKVWSSDELIYGFGGGLLKPVTDTNTAIEDANIIAGSFNFTVAGNVGLTEGQELIDLNSTLTGPQRLLLAAAERSDVNFLLSDRIAATVNFSITGNRLDRRAGTTGTAFNSVFKAGDVLQIEGRTANATETRFFTIATVTADRITFTSSGRVVGAMENNIDVHLSVISLNPMGNDATALATIDVADLRKVISVDGQKFTGFAVGDQIVLTNFSGSADGITAASKRPSVNVNTALTPYIITSIASDGSWVRFDRDLKAEANIAINLRQNIILKWVQVQLRDDVNISVTGNVKGSAGGDTFLSSEEDIRLDLVTAGASARIKAGNSLISVLSGVNDNIRAVKSIIFEAGQGGIGSSAQRLWYDITGGTVYNMTARAATDIWLGETQGDAMIGSIFSKTGDVDFFAAGLDANIVDAANNAFVKVEANDIRLRANGSIGSASNPFEIESRGAGTGPGTGWVTLMAGSDGDDDIFVNAPNGNMILRNVYAGGDVTLEALLSIIDGVDLIDPTNMYSVEDTTTSLPRADISANSITLTAWNGAIGEAGNELDLDMSRTRDGLLTMWSGMDTYVTEAAGKGDIRLNTVGSAPIAQLTTINLTGTYAVGNTVEVTVGSDTVTYTVVANDFTEDGVGGNPVSGASLAALSNIAAKIVALLNAVSAISARLVAAADAASITLSARIAGEAFAVLATRNGQSSGITATETIAAAPGHAAFITAVSGSIFNAAPTGTSNVSGGKAFLFAAVDIGHVDNPIQTQIGTLQGEATTGDTYLVNTGDLAIRKFKSGSGSTGMKVGGQLQITAKSPITVSSDVISAENILFIASDSASENHDNITVNSGVTVRSTNGQVMLFAGDNLTVESSALVSGEYGVSMNTDIGGSVDAGGGNVTIAGKIQTGSGKIYIGTSDVADTVTISASAQFDIGNAPAVGVMNDFVVNTGAGGDSVFIRAAVTADHIVISTGTGDDSLTTTAALTAIGVLAAQNARVGGDVRIDMGTDSNTADTISLGGDVTAARDVVITKLPATNHSVLIGIEKDANPLKPAIGQVGERIVATSEMSAEVEVLFDAAIINPVIALTGHSANVPYTLRVTSTTNNGFKFRVENWTGSAASLSASLKVNWLAVEEGTHFLSDGRVVVAGRVSSSNVPSTVAFGPVFTQVPVVLTSVMSGMGEEGVASDVYDISETAMTLRLKARDADTNGVAAQTVGYIALAAATTVASGTVVAKPSTLTLSSATVTYGQTFADAVVLAQRQTLADGDAGRTVIVTEGTTSTTLRFEEESSDGTHNAETVGVVALAKGFFPISARSPVTSATVQTGQTVTVERDGSVAIYTYLGSNATIDLAAANYGNAALWALRTNAATNTGTLSMTSSSSGAISAGRDVLLRTGGGADVVTLGGTIEADRDILIQTDQGADSLTTTATITAARHLTIEAGGGTDTLLIGAGMATTTGALTVDLMLGDESLTAAQPNRQVFRMSGPLSAATHLKVLASGLVGADVTLTGAATAGDDLLFSTDRGADIITVSGNVQADNVTFSTGDNDDRLAITGTVKSIGGTDSTSGSQATFGDITFDFGTDADVLDTLVLTGSLDAKRDARILKMPKTDYVATSGTVQTRKVEAGERVTFRGSTTAIYEYIGVAAKNYDLGDASIYTSTAFWKIVTNFSENTGKLAATLTAKGEVKAGRDLVVWTGGGDDVWSTVGIMDVTRNILFRLDRGLDRFITTEDITTETGVIAFEMGDSPATERGPFADKDAPSQEVVFDKKAVITAGTDLIVTSNDAGDFRLWATADVVAGRDILITTEGGRDLFDFDTRITAERNIVVQSGIETDVMIVEEAIEATEGAIYIDLDIGNERDLSLRQQLELTEGSIFAGTSFTVLASGKAGTDVTTTGTWETGTFARLSLGTGNDTLTQVGAVDVGTYLSVSMAAGTDTVLFDGTVTTGEYVTINLGAGPVSSATSTKAPTPETLNVTGDVTAGTSISLLKSGTDSATVTMDSKLTAGTFILAQMGSGDDTLLFSDTVTAGTDLTLSTGGGVDSATFALATRAIAGNVLIDFGAVRANRSVLTLSDTLRAGVDLTLVNTGTGGFTATIAAAVTAGGNIVLDTGDGYDLIASEAVITAGRNITVTMDGGGDVFTLSATAGLTAKGDVSVNMGDFDGIADEAQALGKINAGGGLVISNRGAGPSNLDMSGGTITAGKGGFTLQTGDGADTVSMTDLTIISEGAITLDFGGGNDIVIATGGTMEAADNLTLRFGTGNDSVGFTGVDMSGENVLFDQGDGDDLLILTDLANLGGDARILGGKGNDEVQIIRLPEQSAGDTLTIDGGDGADNTRIQMYGGESGRGISYDIAVRDTGAANSGADLLDVRGTGESDLFLVRDGAVALRHGTIAQLEAGNLPGSQERIFYNAAQDGGLWLRTFGGNDFVALDDTSTGTVVDTGTGNDIVRVGQVYADRPDVSVTQAGVIESGTVTRAVTGGWLSDGVSHAALVKAGEGDDRIEVNNNLGALRLEADAGNDAVIVRSFAAAAGSAALVNGNLSVAAGAGVDEVTVIGTAIADTYLMELDRIRGAGRSIALSAATEVLRLNAGAGDDNLTVHATRTATYTEVLGGLGSDLMTLGGPVTGLSASASAVPAAITAETTDGLAFLGANRASALVAAASLAATSLSVAGVLKLDGIAGALRLDGAGQAADGYGRPLVMAEDATARGVTTTVADDAAAVDRLTVRSEGASALTGAMATAVIGGRTFQQITGMGQGDNAVTINAASGTVTQVKGIHATAIEVTEILMGTGADKFNFTDLARAADNQNVTALVILQGGSGADSITAQSVLGRQALVLFGEAERGTAAYGSAAMTGADTINVSAQKSGVILIDGGSDADTITGGAGTVLAIGGTGADVITAGAGSATLIGDSTLLIDRSRGFASIDVATAVGADRLTGGAATEVMVGDNLVTDAFDVQAIRPATLTSTGAGGADIIAANNTGAVIIGGGGIDTITAPGARVVLGDTGTVTLSTAGVLLRAVSDTAATGAADTIRLQSGGGVVIGGIGADTISAVGGDDFLIGDNGDVTFASGVVDGITSLFIAGSGNDSLTGGTGRDVLIGGGGADTLTTGDGENIAIGDHAILSGLAAATAAGILIPRQGSTFVILATATEDASGGADRITGGIGRDLLVGGQGADTIMGGAGDDDIIGGHFVDVARQDVGALALADGANLIDGGAGDDVVLAAHGLIQTALNNIDARLSNGSAASADPLGRLARNIRAYTDPTHTTTRFGANIVTGGAGNDMLFGGQGADLLFGDLSLTLTSTGTFDTRVGANPSVLTGANAYAYLVATRTTTWNAIRTASTTGAVSLMQRTVAAGTEWLFASVASADAGAGDIVIVRPGIGGVPATAGDDYIEGGAGNDVLVGGAGASDLIGGSSRTFGGLIGNSTSASAAARQAGADIILSGNASLTAAPVAGSALVSGNADIWKIVNGNQFATAGSVDGVTRAIIKRAIELAETEPDPASISRLFSASRGDYVVTNQVADRTYGDQSTSRPGLNGAGQSTVIAKRELDLAPLVNVIERNGPQISAVGFATVATAVTPSAAKAASATALGQMYLYDSASKSFTAQNPSRRPVSANAAGVTDVATASGTGYFYVDDRGGVFFYGGMATPGGGGTGGGGTGGGGTGGGGTGVPVDSSLRDIGRSGVLTITPANVGKPVRVDFGVKITNAVVVLTGTQAGGEPYTLRVTDRDENGFWVELSEWEYQDNKRNASETINWVAIEAGVHQLADGRLVEAGTVIADPKSGTVAFAAKFTNTPVVLTSVMSRFKPEAVDSNPTAVTSAGAEIRLESEKARAGKAGKELVGYIAFQTGTGVLRVADGVDSTRRNFTLTGTFTNAVVLAEEQTAKQTDPGVVQIGGVSGTNVTLFFNEDQSAGLDTAHGKEDLGIVGLEAGAVRGVRRSDAAFVPKAVLDQLAATTAQDAPVVGAAGTVSVATTMVGKSVRVEFGSRIDNVVVALTGMMEVSGDPYTLRVLTRDSTGFTFMVDEWEYQDNVRTAAVTVHWVAIQAGVHTLSDGRVVEAGTMLADETSGAVTFKTSFVEAPVVITSVMSAIDPTAVDSSPTRVTRTGFDARLQAEQARQGFTRAKELVGYIAFGVGPNVEFLTTASHFGTAVAFDDSLGSPVVIADTQTLKDTDPQSTMIWNIGPKAVNMFISEEQSLEADRRRSPLDTIGLVGFDAGLLRGTRSGDSVTVTTAQLAEATTAGTALVATQTAVLGASGKVTVATTQVGKSVRVNFGASITNAVVVLTGTSSTASDPFTLRVLTRDATGFTFMLDEWEYQDNARSTSVTVNWVAVAAGVHRMTDGRLVEAGTVLASNQTGSGTFTAAFAAGPAVLTSVMSSHDPSAVDSSARAVTATGFQVRLQSEESRGGTPRPQELVGYIAFGIAGTAARTVEVGTSAAVTSFGRTFTNAVVVADTQTANDLDPQSVILLAQSNTSANLLIAEESSISADTNRSANDTVAMAVFEAGMLRGQRLGTAALVTSAQLAAAANAPAFKMVGQSGSVTVTAAQAAAPIRVNYTSPVENAVIMLTGSHQSGDPYVLRVVSRDANGFSFIIEEWEYQNQSRAKPETIQWIAIAAGKYELADGRRVEVGTVSADLTAKPVTFTAGFTTPPVVLTSVMSNNGTKTANASPFSVTRTGFSVNLQVERGQTQTRVAETVGFIAMSAGGTASSGVAATVTAGSTAVTWTPPAGFASMVAVAGTQTRNNNTDPVSVKTQAVAGSGVRLLLEKEASKGAVLSIPTETIGIIAFLRGAIYGRSL
jgi:Ca2+-binding RTX toxin-like protein